MSFFFGNLKLENVLVAGVRDGVSKQNKPFTTVTVVDADGNTNTLSTSEPDSMACLKSLAIGDRVDLRIVCAGGPKKQYAMIARGANAVMPAVQVSDSVGY